MKTKIKSFVKPITWLPEIPHGWGCGYACIPQGHPAYVKQYDEIDIDVHGGLTFGHMRSEISAAVGDIPEGCEDCYIVGFDTAHYNDGPDKDRAWVEAETERMVEQLEKMW